MRLELVGNGQSLSDDAVVVDLAVDSEGEGAIFVNEGLSTSVLRRSKFSNRAISEKRSFLAQSHTDADNTQTLVGKNCNSVNISTNPYTQLPLYPYSFARQGSFHLSEYVRAVLLDQWRTMRCDSDSLQSGPRWRTLQ